MSTVQDETQARKYAETHIPATHWQTRREIYQWPTKTAEFVITDSGDSHRLGDLIYALSRDSILLEDGTVTVGKTVVTVEWQLSSSQVETASFDVQLDQAGELISGLVAAVAEAGGAPRELRRDPEVDERLREREV